MRFLADECCDMAVVRALRSAGHDVLAVRQESPGIDDEAVALLAELVRTSGTQLMGRFVVVEPGRIRLSPRRGEE